MSSLKGQNNFKRHQQQKVKDTKLALQHALRRLSNKKVKFNSKTQLANYVGDLIGKNPKHLLRNYSEYLEEYLVIQSDSGVDAIADEVASKEVLLTKLRKSRLEVSNIMRECKTLRTKIKDESGSGSKPHQYEIAFSHTAEILHNLIERLGGSVYVDKELKSIIDSTPPAGFSDVVGDKETAKHYIHWLSSHPLYSGK